MLPARLPMTSTVRRGRTIDEKARERKREITRKQKRRSSKSPGWESSNHQCPSSVGRSIREAQHLLTGAAAANSPVEPATQSRHVRNKPSRSDIYGIIILRSTGSASLPGTGLFLRLIVVLCCVSLLLPWALSVRVPLSHVWQRQLGSTAAARRGPCWNVAQTGCGHRGEACFCWAC